MAQLQLASISLLLRDGRKKCSNIKSGNGSSVAAGYFPPFLVICSKSVMIHLLRKEEAFSYEKTKWAKSCLKFN